MPAPSAVVLGAEWPALVDGIAFLIYELTVIEQLLCPFRTDFPGTDGAPPAPLPGLFVFRVRNIAEAFYCFLI
jgi:hypothetical protein